MKVNLLKTFIFLSIHLFLGLSAFSQDKFTISGFVKDDSTGEEVIGAAIGVKELQNRGVIANESGFYSITLPKGEYTLIIQSFGYLSKEVHVVLDKNLTLNISVATETKEVEEIVITGEPKNKNITQAQMGAEKIDVKMANKLPVLFGERDIIKTMQLLPGIKSAGEGNAGFYVRGGSTDQNLVLMDGATIYNSSHMFGFFSVFNSDAIKDATIYKGNMPADFGGRLSSVLDVKMQEGSNQKYGVNAGLGLISSRLTVDGPIVKNKGSFSVSARRSYADLFLKLGGPAVNKTKLNFYDINAKASYILNDKNRVYLSGYMGRDILGLKNLFSINWNNIAGVLRWEHEFNKKFVSNTSFITSDYKYDIKFDIEDFKIKVSSKIRDYGLKQDFQYYFSPRSSLKFGVHSIFHKIDPGTISSSTDQISSKKFTDKNSWENAAYISHDFKVTSRLNVIYGLRLTSFSVLGPGDFFMMDKQGNVIDTLTAKSGEFVKTYVNPEPRFSASYVINDKTSVKASYARNVQNLHLLSNSTTGNPTDLWIPSSRYIKPEIADQVSLGYFRNFKEDKFQFSTEVYYKNFQNQIDYKNGAQLVFNNSVETELLLGKGRAYGIEFFLKKKYGRFNGWIGYTLAKTERKFDLINSGSWYPAKQDRRNDISIVGIYDLTKKWTLSGAFIYYTGNAVTFPSGKYEINGKVINYYTERNGYRMPSYHRLDLGATVQTKKTEKFESSWTFSIYNVYARGNAYTITFKQDPDDPTKTQAVKTSLFQFVPSFSYNFRF